MCDCDDANHIGALIGRVFCLNSVKECVTVHGDDLEHWLREKAIIACLAWALTLRHRQTERGLGID